MKTLGKKLMVLSFLSTSLLTLNHCGTADFDNPPDIAGTYTKNSEKCTEAFLEMPLNLEIQQIDDEIEIDPGIGSDLEGSVDNNGNISVEEPADKTKCTGKYEDDKERISLNCNMDGIKCSGIYQRD